MPEVDPALIDAVLNAELALMTPAIRTSRPHLESLLHPDFREIGASGKMWTRDELMQMMLEEAAGGEAPSHDITAIEVRRIAPGLLHLTYESHSSRGRNAARSSIWCETDHGLRILFHQGTLLP